ncbi:MAG: malate/lactate/ureidoglycolate dehydrogenase [Rhizobacter sp.]|nr:malate/lactate/ureidoglycolate dehydrogenase [Rhizobacter sp.]
MTEHLIPTPALQQWVADLWRAAGCSSDEARLTADHLVGANLSGHDSHGVGMVPRYVKSWLGGELQLNQHVDVVQAAGPMLSLDGRRGMGPVMAFEAMQQAIATAREHGVCVMGLKHSHHIGRVGHWAEQAVAAGMVSVHFVNAVSKPVVAPHGGRQGRFVTNPFTVGIPVAGREPLLLDFATSAIAMGKVRVAHNKHVAVPAGALLDAEGRETTDPGVMFGPEGAPDGALLTFAGHKGYALAMVCELLGAALTGGETTRPGTIAGLKQAVWNNMLALVFDPLRLNSAELFSAEVLAYIEWVQSSALRPGTEAILMPGDPERAWRRARAEFIPIDADTLAELDQAAASVAQARAIACQPLSSLAR